MQVNVFCAFLTEADSLIEYFKAEQVYRSGHLKIYSANNLNIIITGLGKKCIEEACDVVASKNSGDEDVWINWGVAGHRSLSLGSVVFVDRVFVEGGTSALDLNVNQSYFDALVDNNNSHIHSQSLALKTVLRPESQYLDNYFPQQ